MSPARLLDLALRVILLSLPLSAVAQDVARMRDVVRRYVDDQTFMGTVLVARGGEVLLSEGFGFANLEWRMPNTPVTKFRLGSVTKQFTAAAILLLAERGKLSLDDSVKKHWPDAPTDWESVTFFHLLTHTAGMPNMAALPNFATYRLSPSPVARTVALLKDRPLEFAPGTEMRYSNSGYLLLGYLIERISGQSYSAFLRDNIFTPLGMMDTGYDAHAEITERRASGYVAVQGGFANAPYVDMTIPHAAGALYSTTEDLLRWTQGLFGGKLLTPASLEKMTMPFKNDYALGVSSLDRNGQTAITHGGAIEGFNTSLTFYPADRTTVVVLGNVSGPAPGQIATQIGAVLYGGPVTLPTSRGEVQLSPEVLAEYAGTYPLAPDFTLTIAVRDGALISRASGQPEIPLYAEANDKFFARALDAQVEFVRSDDGRIEALILRQGPTEIRATRQ